MLPHEVDCSYNSLKKHIECIKFVFLFLFIPQFSFRLGAAVGQKVSGLNRGSSSKDVKVSLGKMNPKLALMHLLECETVCKS